MIYKAENAETNWISFINWTKKISEMDKRF